MFNVTKKAEELYKDCISLNRGNGITLIERGENYTQFYCFASEGGGLFINEYFINNQKFTGAFTDHAKSKPSIVPLFLKLVYYVSCTLGHSGDNNE